MAYESQQPESQVTEEQLDQAEELVERAEKAAEVAAYKSAESAAEAHAAEAQVGQAEQLVERAETAAGVAAVTSAESAAGAQAAANYASEARASARYAAQVAKNLEDRATIQRTTTPEVALIYGAVTTRKGKRVPNALIDFYTLDGKYLATVNANGKGEYSWIAPGPGEYQVVIRATPNAAPSSKQRVVTHSASRQDLILDDAIQAPGFTDTTSPFPDAPQPIEIPTSPQTQELSVAIKGDVVFHAVFDEDQHNTFEVQILSAQDAQKSILPPSPTTNPSIRCIDIHITKSSVTPGVPPTSSYGYVFADVCLHTGDNLYVFVQPTYTDNNGRVYAPRNRQNVFLVQVPFDTDGDGKVTLNIADVIIEQVSNPITGKVMRQVLGEEGELILEPFPGVPVLLFNSDEEQIEQEYTDAQGVFSFEADLTPGQALTLRLPAEMTDDEGSLVLPTPELTIQLQTGVSVPIPNLIYQVVYAQVIGQVTNGRQGVKGVPVTLIDLDTGQTVLVPDPADPTQFIQATTDQYGFYQFATLVPGNYQLTFPTSVTDSTGQGWELRNGQSGSQSIKVKFGQMVTANPVIYDLEEHKIIWTVTSNGQPAPGRLVEVKDDAGSLVSQGRTGADGKVVFLLDDEGDYTVVVYTDDRASGGQYQYPVSVHSTVTGTSSVAPSTTPFTGDGGGPNVDDLGEAVVDSQAYPILTEAVPSTSAPGPSTGGPSTGAPGPAALGATVQAALREVLGWRPKTTDTKGFVSALNQSFELKDFEGHVEFKWTPRSYAVTVADDLGAITGAQASIYNRAKVALDQSLPLLEGLYTLTTLTLPEDIEAIRAIVRSEFTQVVNELGVVGGPRVQRVDELLSFLLGSTPVSDAELVGGHLAELGKRLGMKRDNVNTIDDEQNLTNYLIINDYVIGLSKSWDNQRKYFDRLGRAEPFLGTQLVLVSQALTAVAEAVQQTYFTLDSVFLGPAERQTIQLNFKGSINVPQVPGDNDPNQVGNRFTFDYGATPLFVSELLDWVWRVTSQEAPQMVQDSGKDGVLAFFPVINKLRKLMYGAMIRSAGGVQDPRTQSLPAGYGTPRVQRALAELADELDNVANLAGQIAVQEQGPRAEIPVQAMVDALRDPAVIQALQQALLTPTSSSAGQNANIPVQAPRPVFTPGRSGPRSSGTPIGRRAP